MKKVYKGLDRSSFKLIIINDSTVVDEKNRRVIHTIDWTLKMPTLLNDFNWLVTSRSWEFVGRAKGVAICHEEDTFDAEIGKKMARAIAESNAYANASKRVNKLLFNLFRILNQLNEQEVDFRIKSGEISTHNREYMKSLIGE